MKALNAAIAKLLEGPRVGHHGVLGVFYYVDDVEQAVQALRGLGYREIVVKSPVPHHSIEKALGQGPSLVRWVTAVGAFLGATGGFSLCIWSMFSWPLVVGGKELTSLPPFVVIGYESFILLGALSNLIGMLALARLPQIAAPSPYDPRFTEDRIGVWVPSTGPEAARAYELMKGHGAEEVKLHA
jgi:hypothetical protein